MNITSPQNKFAKTFNFPYQLGVYLAANAVQDACVVMDGLNCVMPKIDFLSGNHDLYSTLLSPDGRHRVICTMSGPLPQRQDPEKKLAALLRDIAGRDDFSVIMLTGLPFLKIAGMDYEGIASGINGRIPVVDVPAGSLEADWLEGYARALDALARALPSRKFKKRRRSVALVGYFMDRNERDHSANIAEISHLLELCGLELICVFPSGGGFSGLSAALEAEVVVSLPYGRKAAARIAARSGARLVETGLPMGLKGTALWLEAVRRAAGIKGGVPPEVRVLETKTAQAMAPALHMLLHRNVVYSGDPYLFSAFASFASELKMRVNCVVINSFARPLGAATLPRAVMFAPDTGDACAAVKKLSGYCTPDLVVGNSFSVTEGLAASIPFLELGFPSYGHHCLGAEPFLGFGGALALTGRILNCLVGGRS